MDILINGKFSRVEATLIYGGDENLTNNTKNGAISSIWAGNKCLFKNNSLINVACPPLVTGDPKIRINLLIRDIWEKKKNVYELRVAKKSILTSMYPTMSLVWYSTVYSIAKNYVVNIYTNEDYSSVYYVMKATGELRYAKLEEQLKGVDNFKSAEYNLIKDYDLYEFSTNSEQQEILKWIVTGKFSNLESEAFRRFLGQVGDSSTYEYWKGVWTKDEKLRKLIMDDLNIEIPIGSELHSRPLKNEVIMNKDYIIRSLLNKATSPVNPEEAF